MIALYPTDRTRIHLARLCVPLACLILMLLGAMTGRAAPLAQSGDLPLQIIVRTADGAPAAGIGITLRPAPADLDGPPTPLPEQQGVTNAQGRAAFASLGPWVWYATFQGTIAGRPLQEAADQGQPPWGTNPGGNGFPLLVEGQLENEGNLPPATPGSALTSSRFVLTLDQGRWIPALDLADEATPPRSLPTLSAGPSSLPSDPQAEAVTPVNSWTLRGEFALLSLVAAIGLIALYLNALHGRNRVKRTVSPATSLRGATRAGVAGDDASGAEGE